MKTPKIILISVICVSLMACAEKQDPDLNTIIYDNPPVVKKDCTVDSLYLGENTSVAKQYFEIGACHSNNKDIELAVEQWEKLAILDGLDMMDKELQILALFNLGYFMFEGQYITVNKAKGLAYWEKSVELGGDGFVINLCEAYADTEAKEYNSEKAFKYCKAAKNYYQNAKDEPAYDQVKLEMVNKILLELEQEGFALE